MLTYLSTQYGYRRVNVQSGVDYIMDLILYFKKFRGRRATLPVRRHAYIQQTFGITIFIEERQLREYQLNQSLNVDIDNTHVHIILPLSGRSTTFARFAQNFD